MDATRRYFLLTHDGGLWLVDSATGRWEALARADMADDGNRCVTPRQGKFSPLGGRVAWILEGARQLRVRELASGREWSVPSHGRIWAGWPADDHDGAILLEIDRNSTDWPKQKTSCSCWWCNRFARSAGYYGWSGPKFAIHQVARDGQRSSGEIDETSFAMHDKTTHGASWSPAGTAPPTESCSSSDRGTGPAEPSRPG